MGTSTGASNGTSAWPPSPPPKGFIAFDRPLLRLPPPSICASVPTTSEECLGVLENISDNHAPPLFNFFPLRLAPPVDIAS